MTSLVRSAKGSLAPVTGILLAGALFGVALYRGYELLLIGATGASIIAVMVLRRPILGLYLGFMLVPLEAAGRIIPTNPYFTWAKVVLLLTTLALFQHLLVNNMSVKLPPAGLNLYFVLVLALVGTALWPIFGNPMWGVVAFVGQAMIVVIAANVVREKGQFENCVLSIVGGSVFVTVIGVMDVILKRSTLGTVGSQIYATSNSPMFRVTATFYDPNMLGRYMAFAMVMTICALRFPRFKRLSPLLWTLLIPQGFVLLNTFSRGSVLSLLAALALMLLWDKGVRRKIGTLVVITLSGVLLYVLADRVVQVLLQRLTGGSGSLEVDLSRVMIYQLGMRAFWLSPIVGFGPDNVPKAIGQFYALPLSPHNMYLEVLLATGALGLVAFTWFVIAEMRAGFILRGTEYTDYARAAIFALLVVLLTGLTLHAFKSNELWASLALLAALPGISVAEGPES